MASGIGERRLRAVVSGDGLGYSRLMADDEVNAVRTLGRDREMVQLLAGRPLTAFRPSAKPTPIA